MLRHGVRVTCVLLTLALAFCLTAGAGASTHHKTKHKKKPTHHAVATTTTTTLAPPAEAAKLCSEVSNFYSQYHSRSPQQIELAAQKITRAASPLDIANPTAYHQLAIDIENWLVDVSALNWKQDGKAIDKPTTAVANDCAALEAQGYN